MAAKGAKKRFINLLLAASWAVERFLLGLLGRFPYILLGGILILGSVKLLEAATADGGITIPMMRGSADRAEYNIILWKQICFANGAGFPFNFITHFFTVFPELSVRYISLIWP